jgi:hypothetical protein
MRSFREIRFRLRQEATNLYLAASPPRVSSLAKITSAPLPQLPAPGPVADRLRDSGFAKDIEEIASGILRNKIPLLGMGLQFTGSIPWRKDWVHGREFPGTPYFRRVPYLNAEQVGDHKIVWELNRHQHLVLLAQAYLLTGRREFFDILVSHWEDWVRENPFQRGLNWTSALEVAFRALSWTWVYHLAGDRMDEPLRRRFLTELYRHGCHIENNLSVYFSPNTHLLGEAVALHALGTLFPEFPRSTDWHATGSRIAREELQRQIHADGSHFEQSTYYHVYALDFLLFHYVLAGRPSEFDAPLIRMAEYLDAVQGAERRIPFIGDDDGGRLFHPYGERDCFGRATLATCAALFDRPHWLHSSTDLQSQAAWWIGASVLDTPATERPPHTSQMFSGSGIAVFEGVAPGGDALFAVADAGGFGALRAGHSHSDTLSIVVRRTGQDLLIDPGTFSYCDPQWRDRFRGSAAHNTISVDGQDQALPLGQFAWASKPSVEIRAWKSTDAWDYLDAVCNHAGHAIEHRRRILFHKDRGWFLIVDEIHLDKQTHLIEQNWHSGCPIVPLGPHAFQFGEPGLARLVLDESVECSVVNSWRSLTYGVKVPTQSIVCQLRPTRPFAIAAAIVELSCPAETAKVVEDGSGTAVMVGDILVRFPD